MEHPRFEREYLQQAGLFLERMNGKIGIYQLTGVAQDIAVVAPLERDRAEILDPFVASETSGTATRPGDDLYRGRNSHLVEQRAFNHGAREPLQSGSICQAGHHRALA